MDAPELLVLDVNETLSDVSALGARFADVGAPAEMATPWFTGVLRDGFVLTILGGSRPFAEVAADGLRTVLSMQGGLDRPLDDAVAHVLAGFSELPVHPDVAEGLPRLAAGGVRMITLSNGATAVAEKILTAAGLRDTVEDVLSVEDAGAWKPEPRAYAYGVRKAQVAERAAMMVACHPWDLAGAHAAGYRTAYVDRTGAPWPSVFPEPDLTVSGFVELADVLLDGR